MVEEVEFRYLATIGRRSGMPREIEIWFTRVDGHYYVIAEPGQRARRVRNLQVEPRVHVRAGAASVAAAARVVTRGADPDLYAGGKGTLDTYHTFLAGDPAWSPGLPQAA